MFFLCAPAFLFCSPTMLMLIFLLNSYTWSALPSAIQTVYVAEWLIFYFIGDPNMHRKRLELQKHLFSDLQATYSFSLPFEGCYVRNVLIVSGEYKVDLWIVLQNCTNLKDQSYFRNTGNNVTTIPSGKATGSRVKN